MAKVALEDLDVKTLLMELTITGPVVAEAKNGNQAQEVLAD
jgi:hypothetical protein